ncbi:copper resistance protein NlpE [Acinetobacter ihumii]|uniref:copper resistance protein NlpE n=1 Tax=Acinetobacter ihumii TaxID=2483802 RepID=UPI00102F4953|nr:copper resistance protein NlpE [Acinetobacter ihumii]
MKKSLLAIAIVSTLLVACSKKENQNETTVPADQNTVASAPAETATAVDTAHTAENSLDWAGEYKGKLPCADCEGIQTELELHDNKTFELKETYMGSKSDGKPVETKGSFSFDNSKPSVIILDTQPDKRQFFIGENTATALDMEGNKIEGAMADLYVLKKESH